MAQQILLPSSACGINAAGDVRRGDATHEIVSEVAYRRLAIVNVAFVGRPAAGNGNWVAAAAFRGLRHDRPPAHGLLSQVPGSDSGWQRLCADAMRSAEPISRLISDIRICGEAARGLEPVARAFAEDLEREGEVGATLGIDLHG
jgi:hypothetical protein